jgi:hypothetical protein
VIFDFASNHILVVEDADDNGVPGVTQAADGAIRVGADRQAGEPVTLPKDVYFDRIFGRTTGAPYAAMNPDGGMVYYDDVASSRVVEDVSWSRHGGDEDTEGTMKSPPAKSDIVLRRGRDSAGADAKIYIDVLPVTGSVRKMEYFERKGEPLP